MKAEMLEINCLTNYFLIAMPMLIDPYFNRAVIYICEHNEKGAVGIVVNQPLASLKINFSELLQVVPKDDRSVAASASPLGGNYSFPILCGGPVHPERGFVIHPPGGVWESTLKMNSEISVTTSKDILQAISTQSGPTQFIFSLGYANWVAGQLEQEIISNLWLMVPASPTILFEVPYSERWSQALGILGVDYGKLVYSGGHA